jgi:hypothetical protein
MKLAVTITEEELNEAVLSLLEKKGLPIMDGSVSVDVTAGRSGNPATVVVNIDTDPEDGSDEEAEDEAETTKVVKRRSRKMKEADAAAEKKAVETKSVEEIISSPEKVTKTTEPVVEEVTEVEPVVEEAEPEVVEETKTEEEPVVEKTKPSTNLFD